MGTLCLCMYAERCKYIIYIYIYIIYICIEFLSRGVFAASLLSVRRLCIVGGLRPMGAPPAASGVACCGCRATVVFDCPYLSYTCIHVSIYTCIHRPSTYMYTCVYTYVQRHVYISYDICCHMVLTHCHKCTNSIKKLELNCIVNSTIIWVYIFFQNCF
jgi:hypothetical protein